MNNTSALSGGAISNENAGTNATINNSTISGNVAQSGSGGGIANQNSASITLNHVTVANNDGASGGNLWQGQQQYPNDSQ